MQVLQSENSNRFFRIARGGVAADQKARNVPYLANFISDELGARLNLCDSSGLSDTSGSQIMVLPGGPKDEQVRVRSAAEAAQV
jgi:hypothetical protein